MNFENDENLDYLFNKIAANVIKEKRIQKNYSLEELAKKLGNIVTRQSLFRYENKCYLQYPLRKPLKSARHQIMSL